MDDQFGIVGWVEEEFSAIEFGDVRLNRRLKLCVSQACSIGESNPDRCRSKADLKAQYRFVDNEKVGMEAILEQHNVASRSRCAKASKVYLVQDTTEVDLTKAEQVVQGVGPLGTSKRVGFFFHPLYAIDNAGIPLGVVDQLVWTRDPSSLDSTSKERASSRKKSCFEEKESCRWLEMFQSGEQLARSLPETDFVIVSDSESDIGELLIQAIDLSSNCNFIIRQRSVHNIVNAKDPITGKSIEASNLDEALKQVPWRTNRLVKVSGRPEPVMPDDKKRVRKQARSSRETVVQIRAVTITIAGPRRLGGGQLEDVTLNAVEVLEANPPEGETPIRWVLLTSLPIATLSDLEQIVDGYCVRWGVELFFKTLKSGLNIEDMKYETLKRYLAAFAILSVVAWRIEQLKQAARHDSDAPVEKYVPAQEWIAVMIFVHRKPIKQIPKPTIQEYMYTVAELGGYLRRKSQGPPGAQTIWRGMRRAEIIVEAYAAFTP